MSARPFLTAGIGLLGVAAIAAADLLPLRQVVPKTVDELSPI